VRVTHIISNLELGGAEGALCTLLEAQAGGAVRHTVISMLAGGAYVPRLRGAGAVVIELEGTRSLAFAGRLAELGRAVAGSRPDLMQGWMYHANIAASLLRLARYYACPVIWGVRQSASRLSDDAPMTRGLILAGAALAFEPCRIVYNSEAGARTHERLGYPVRKRVVILNGVDCQRFRARPEARGRLLAELGLPDEALLVGRVARYAPMKDFGTLFAAFGRVRQQRPSANLVLVGTGMARSNGALAADWQGAGAPGGVHFLGPRPDVERVYPALDVAVSSSSSNEGFPNVAFEALVSGTPVVATDVGTGEELGACGAVVVEPRQPRALANAILRVLAMPAESRADAGQRARSAVIERLGVDAFSSQFLNLWRGVLAKRAAAPAEARS
jgi:glycosyltransferase involved in cell wall biosynthesis